MNSLMEFGRRLYVGPLATDEQHIVESSGQTYPTCNQSCLSRAGEDFRPSVPPSGVLPVFDHLDWFPTFKLPAHLELADKS